MPPETPATPPQAGDVPQPPGQEPTGTTETAEAKLARLERELTETRKEAAKYRTSAKAQEAAAAESERKAAEEQGRFKELYEVEQVRRAELEGRIAAAERAAQRQEAAVAAGLPLSMAARLQGATPDELLADAKQMAELMKPSAPGTGSTNPPAQRQAPPATFDPKNPPKLSQISWKK